MKKTIIIIVIFLSIVYYAYFISLKSNTISYTVPITTVKQDTINNAKIEIQKQIDILNVKDKKLSDKISALEIQRDRIRKVKMSFSSALK